MIQLTAEQHEALSKTGSTPVRAVDPTTNAEYVLVRADVYDRISAMFSDDDGWARDASRAAMEAFARDGWDDPRMDVYESLDPGKPQ